MIAVSLPRGRDLVMAVLAVLKSGAAYLPLDPALPAERRVYLLRAAGAYLLIGADRGEAVEALAPCAGDGDRAAAPLPEDLAYMIFISGFTGRPKPVAVTHRSLAHHARTIAGVFG